MMNEEHRTIGRRAWAAYDAGDVEAFAACVTPDWREHDGDEGASTLDDMRGLMKAQRKAFPDKHTEIVQEVVEGDLLVQRTISTATHTGRYFDLDPTGRTVRLHEINIHRIVGARIAETWIAVGEPGGFYKQLSGRDRPSG
jgi:predicted ester cyclase